MPSISLCTRSIESAVKTGGRETCLPSVHHPEATHCAASFAGALEGRGPFPRVPKGDFWSDSAIVRDLRSGPPQPVGDLWASFLEPVCISVRGRDCSRLEIWANDTGLIILKEDGFDLGGSRPCPPLPPPLVEEECRARALFGSGAAMCPIRTRHPCPFLAADHHPF